MVDVTTENFDKLWQDIQKDIFDSDFMAFDTEFTGLQLDSSEKTRCFSRDNSPNEESPHKESPTVGKY